MNTVIVRPERCVGCLQCRFACSVAHSFSGSPFTAPYERLLSKPRISVGLSGRNEPFPNKCRHCDPAPCERACPTGAIHREAVTGVVLVDPGACITCGMCATACPFSVIRYRVYPGNRVAAHKCDQCIARLREGRDPACVEACKVGALLYGDVNRIMDAETDKLAGLVFLGIREKPAEGGPYRLLHDFRTRYEATKRRYV